jgi:hypothetical protein
MPRAAQRCNRNRALLSGWLIASPRTKLANRYPPRLGVKLRVAIQPQQRRMHRRNRYPARRRQPRRRHGICQSRYRLPAFASFRDGDSGWLSASRARSWAFSARSFSITAAASRALREPAAEHPQRPDPEGFQALRCLPRIAARASVGCSRRGKLASRDPKPR